MCLYVYFYNMADISMSLDDTLELDTIIKTSSIAQDPIGTITYSGPNTKDYNMNGIETHTSVFDPQQAGTYTISVNGQELLVEVTNPSTIPDSGVFRYDFEDNSDTSTAIDSFTNDTKTAQDASITNGSYSSTSKWGVYGLSSSGNVDVDPNLTYGDLPSPYSYAVWVRPTESPTWSQNMGLLGSGWAVSFNLPSGRSDVRLKTWASEGGSENTLYSNTTLSKDTWYLLGFSLTSDTAKLVVNGSVEKTQTGYHSSENNSVSTVKNMVGVVDRVSMYSRELTSTEWSNLYNTGSII